MIQRLQSLFLFGVGVTMIVMLFLPIWEKQDTEAGKIVTVDPYYFTLAQLNADGSTGEVISESGIFWIAGLCVLAALIAFTSLFSYKNRLTQMKLNALNSLVIVGAVGSMFYIIYFKGQPILNPQDQGDFLAGFYLPVVALFLNSIANRYIRKDEKLVRSVDRIR
jgi:glucan phosphoethanolaminetransferase (alkaline phosphatase superfamily)